jgi:serine O-acetyltransferase
MTDSMVKSRKELKEYIDVELKRYQCNLLKYIFQIGEKAILRKYIILLRKTEYYVNTSKKIRATIHKIRLANISNKYSMHIPINCCDKGLKIMHVGPILMNSNTRCGKNLAIHINTSLVAGGRSNKAPIVGDNVVVGVGAVIVGGIKIANNVAIGANAVVNKDVLEENIAVAGVPAKKISNNGSATWNPKEKDN